MNNLKIDPFIICPKCKKKQNGVIQFIDLFLDEKPGDMPINIIIPLIRCCVKKCQHIIHSTEFKEIEIPPIKLHPGQSKIK